MTGSKIIKHLLNHLVLAAILIAAMIPQTVYAQADSTIKISISHKKSPLKEILSDISDQTGFLFVYSSQSVDDQVKLDIKIRNKKLTTILAQISGMLDFSYIISDKHIILKPRKKVVTTNDQYKPNAKNATISGYVHDATTHEILIGATITAGNGAKGTLTNSYGFYSLTLEKGEYNITYSYLGYQREYININLKENVTIDKDLEQIDAQIEAISVTADKNSNNIKETLHNSSSLKASDFGKYSGLIIGGDLVGMRRDGERHVGGGPHFLDVVGEVFLGGWRRQVDGDGKGLKPQSGEGRSDANHGCPVHVSFLLTGRGTSGG